MNILLERLLGKERFNAVDRAVAGRMAHHGHFLLRISLGVVFIWFGALKVFAVSPATEIVEKTVYWLPPSFFIPLLGWWEVAIGVCLMVRPLVRAALFLLFLQMPGTFLPLIVLPHVCFISIPLIPTMEGQYIIKNLVLISAGIVIGGTVRDAKEDA